MPFKVFQYVGRHHYVTINEADLTPGKKYRAVVKFCAEELCFPLVYGNGVTVIVNPPTTGNITVDIQNTTNHHQVRQQNKIIFITVSEQIKMVTFSTKP